MFLKIATSLLKIDGRRTKFLDRLPILPATPGFPKHAGLKANAKPVASAVPPLIFGSRSRTGRVVASPPVKSLIPVHRQVVVEPGSSANPGAQSAPVGKYFCPVEIE